MTTNTTKTSFNLKSALVLAVLVLMMTFSAMSVSAASFTVKGTKATNGTTTWTYTSGKYASLNTYQKNLFTKIMNYIYAGKSVTIKNVSAANYKKVVNVINDTYGYTSNGAYINFSNNKIVVDGKRSKAELTKALTTQKRIKAYAKASGAMSTSNVNTKVTRILNWISKNYRYSTASKYNDFYTAVAYKTAACGGYAETFQYMCVAAGINAANVKTVIGYANGAHEWNRIKLGSRWYYVDATWYQGYNGKKYGPSVSLWSSHTIQQVTTQVLATANSPVIFS